MYNRYIGNTGKVCRVDDTPPKNTDCTRKGGASIGQKSQIHDSTRRAELPPPQYQRPPSPLSGLSGIAAEILKRLSPASFDSEDIILMLILWLLYKESGDEELLFTMIALFLL